MAGGSLARACTTRGCQPSIPHGRAAMTARGAAEEHHMRAWQAEGAELYGGAPGLCSEATKPSMAIVGGVRGLSLQAASMGFR